MKILDRYETKQLLPAWLWCLLVFVTVSLFIDLFEHLDEILRYSIPLRTMLRYYLNFTPLVFVQACPLALLLSTAFVATRLVRHQELLAMNAGGRSRLRSAVPFLFVGWLVTGMVFFVNDLIVPNASATYQRLREEAFRAQQRNILTNVATMDDANRLYHAKEFRAKDLTISDLTILEHDARNRPRRNIYAKRAEFTPEGLRVHDGTITRMDIDGALESPPERFTDRVLNLPLTPEAFRKPDTDLSMLSYRELRQMLGRLRTIGITNLRRQSVELAAKVTLPLMNLVLCLIAFVGATKPASRGRLQELGVSLGWGILYYIVVASFQGLGKEGMLPVILAVWAPHLIAVGLCFWAMYLRD